MPIVGYGVIGAPGDLPGEARGDDRADAFMFHGLACGMKRVRERTATGEAVTGQVITHDFTLIKYNCLASPLLIKALSLNMTFDEASLKVAHEDEEDEVDYWTIDLGVVKVVEYSQSNDGGPDSATKLVERIGLTAEKALFTYTAPKRSPKSGEVAEFEHYLDPNSRGG